MIRVVVKKVDGRINYISMKGHAEYADYGSDIVCASASSIAITTVNACQKIKENIINFTSKDGFLEIEVKGIDEKIDILLNNMIDLLEELGKSYPKNITLKIN